MALLYGRAGRLTAKNGRFWPGQWKIDSTCQPEKAKRAYKDGYKLGEEGTCLGVANIDRLAQLMNLIKRDECQHWSRVTHVHTPRHGHPPFVTSCDARQLQLMLPPQGTSPRSKRSRSASPQAATAPSRSTPAPHPSVAVLCRTYAGVCDDGFMARG